MHVPCACERICRRCDRAQIGIRAVLVVLVAARRILNTVFPSFMEVPDFQAETESLEAVK